jgi:hypothetical protein
MRKRKEVKPLPDGLREGCIVKITSPNNFRTPRVGFLLGYCEKNDGGLKVYAPIDDIAEWYCIQEEHGDSITKLK